MDKLGWEDESAIYHGVQAGTEERGDEQGLCHPPPPKNLILFINSLTTKVTLSIFLPFWPSPPPPSLNFGSVTEYKRDCCVELIMEFYATFSWRIRLEHSPHGNNRWLCYVHGSARRWKHIFSLIQSIQMRWSEDLRQFYANRYVGHHRIRIWIDALYFNINKLFHRTITQKLGDYENVHAYAINLLFSANITDLSISWIWCSIRSSMLARSQNILPRLHLLSKHVLVEWLETSTLPFWKMW